eukprot:2684467-Amphidinium_carterae.1
MATAQAFPRTKREKKQKSPKNTRKLWGGGGGTVFGPYLSWKDFCWHGMFRLLAAGMSRSSMRVSGRCSRTLGANCKPIV